MSEIGEFTTTGLILAILCVGLIIWDIYLYVYKREKTISAEVYKLRYISPPSVFLLGFIMGHLLW